MANLLDVAPKRKTPAARKGCVDKIGSRPRGILCVPKIRPGEREWRQTYGDIANSVRKSTIGRFYWLTRRTRPGLQLWRNGSDFIYTKNSARPGSGFYLHKEEVEAMRSKIANFKVDNSVCRVQKV